jgi:hypothetical protein
MALTLAEREIISRNIATGHADRFVFRVLGRHQSVIAGEIAHNGGRTGIPVRSCFIKAAGEKPQVSSLREKIVDLFNEKIIGILDGPSDNSKGGRLAAARRPVVDGQAHDCDK